MRRAALITLLVLLGGCARSLEFPPRSPIPARCKVDCPIRSPEEQEDSLPDPWTTRDPREALAGSMP